MTSSGTKKYPKGALKLMVTAERLFGEHGIDGVSLRQIVSEAGQANNSAVQHHFGTREGLVQAVYDMRLPKLDDARQVKLDTFKDKSGDICPRNLIAALILPVIEAFNEQDRNTYAAFLARLMHKDESIHPFFHSKVPQPAAREIIERLEACYAHLPSRVFNVRIRLASGLSLDYIAERRRLKESGKDPYPDEHAFWNEMIHSIESIFQAPFPVRY